MYSLSKFLAVFFALINVMALSHANDIKLVNETTPNAVGLIVGSGLKTDLDNKALGGYFVFFERADSAWSLKDISEKRQKVGDFSKQEILFFSKDLKFVQPDYRDYLNDGRSKEMRCWTGILRADVDNGTRDYNPCKSSLTSLSSMEISANLFATVFTLGLTIPGGTTQRTVVVDQEKVMALIRQTDALAKLRNWAIESDLVMYRTAFKFAKTSIDLAVFVKKYENNDPENFVPEANIRLLQQLARETELNAVQLAEEEKAKELAVIQAKADNESERMRVIEFAESRKQRLKKISEFRKVMTDGDETNCGPIIENKGKILKISAPVANYGNEHWIRREDLLPPGFQCTFTNGAYQPPQL